MDGDSEEVMICDYFNKGFIYDEIFVFLDKYYGVRRSIVMLKRCLKEYGLKRWYMEYDVGLVWDKIRSLLDGFDCMGGYRYVWYILKM